MPGKLDFQVKPGYLSRFEPIKWNLTTMSDYYLGCNLNILQCFQEIIRFEPGNMYRLTEPGKNARFDPNLDYKRTILKV